jgi:CxxC motif-containing protein
MPGPSTKNSSEMKKSTLACSILFILVIVCFTGCKRKDKQLNISVKMEITGRGYYQYGQDTKVRDDYFSRVCITNHEDSTISFWMMSCQWMFDVMKFNQDSLEFSIGNCTKDVPVKVELKPGKTIIFYPVFHDNSKKRFHPVYSDRPINNKQIRIGFNLMKNVSTYPKGEHPELVSSGDTYWSNPVSLDYRNNGYKIINN